jgi:hypothetical protein
MHVQVKKVWLTGSVPGRDSYSSHPSRVDEKGNLVAYQKYFVSHACPARPGINKKKRTKETWPGRLIS